jgi:DNA-binding transcriptional LysR family regulator
MDRLTATDAFIRVVDAGSFSSAATQLRMGQSAVSKSIAQLEERLSVRLLLRTTRFSALCSPWPTTRRMGESAP